MTNPADHSIAGRTGSGAYTAEDGLRQTTPSSLRLAAESLEGLTKAGEDYIWRPAVRAKAALEQALTLLQQLQDKLDEAQAEAETASPYCSICGSCGSGGCGCEHKCIYSTAHPDAIAEAESLTARAEAAEARVLALMNALGTIALLRMPGDNEPDTPRSQFALAQSIARSALTPGACDE